jgi:signal transduction histidine kinase
MRSMATEGLMRAYLQKLDRQNYLATGVAIFIVTISLFWMLFHVGGDRIISLVSKSTYTLGSVIGASLAWITMYRVRRGTLQLETRYQFAWLLIGLGLLADGLGEVYFLYLEYNRQLTPAPTYADIGFTLFYPLVFVGLILVLMRRKSKRTCVLMGLDALITTLCILGVSWYFIIAPAFLMQSQTHITTAKLVTLLSYPFWDILFMLAIVLISQQCAERTLHPSLLLCAAGLLATIWADTAYAYFTALGTYRSGTFYIDTFWFIGALLIGLAALYQYAALVRGASSKGTPPTERDASNKDTQLGRHEQSAGRFVLLQRTLIFLPLGILLALTLSSEVLDDKARALPLLLLTALVSIIMAVRYLLTMYENEHLLQEQERQLQEAEQLYLHLQTTYQRLSELDQLKDQFLMTASHELRTPLSSVQGYLELMAQFHDILPPEKHWEYLQKARRSCEELVILFGNVMDVSRLEVEAKIPLTHLEQVSVQDMMQSVMNLIEARVIQEQREVHLHIPPHLYVRADAGRLRQVLLNISMNALKYSPLCTPIAFSAQIATDSNSEVVISVTDKGKGIAPQDQARVFQRFVRLEQDRNSSVQGSGLGLYISLRLIEAMNGKIRIESKGIPGEDTTFHIQLPIAMESVLS